MKTRAVKSCLTHSLSNSLPRGAGDCQSRLCIRPWGSFLSHMQYPKGTSNESMDTGLLPDSVTPCTRYVHLPMYALNGGPHLYRAVARRVAPWKLLRSKALLYVHGE